MKKDSVFLLYLISISCLLLTYGAVFALDSQAKQAGKDSGRLFNNNYKSETNLNTKLNTPLTQNTPLATVDNSHTGSATTFCGVGDVQNEKIAIQVTVSASSLTTYTDTNNDGVLDSMRTFSISQTCLDGYKYGTIYYKWTVSPTGFVSTAVSTALTGCIDPLTNPPTYVGGALAQLYASATGKTITNSSFTGSTVTYYAGTVKDCTNANKDVSATQYYDNPYKINDAAITKAATCNPTDPACQAYQGIQSSSSNVSSSPAGPGTCTVTRNVINAQGPQNGIICEGNKIYYPNTYTQGICYKTAGSTWDYNAGFKVRCDSYGKNLTLEGWATWEGSPCGVAENQTANWPPLPQITYPLTYGGNAASIEIGRLSVNRRMCGSNCAYNDNGDVRCVSDVTPIRVNLSRTCNANNVTCNYNVSVVNAPACAAYIVAVTAPTGENIDDQCATYEQQNCNLIDEYWYTSTGSSVQTIKNGTPTNTYPASTCKTFSALGSVCKDWWSKTRTYSCGGANRYTPDISHASEVMNSAADSSDGTVTYNRSAFNTEITPNCLLKIDYEFPFTTVAACSAQGGTVSCPPGYIMSNNVCVGAPVCPSNSRYNPNTDSCEAPAIPECLEIGFTYNSGTRMCEDEPVCPVGTFNVVTDHCEQAPNPTCESGFVYNSISMFCENSGHCEDGSYDPVSHLCKSSPILGCPPSYNYDSGRNICQMAPPCIRGTYVPERDRCEYTPARSCPNNFNYNLISQQCEAAPNCLIGNYNAAIKACEYTPAPECLINFTYDSASKSCQTTPECLLSATYDSSTNICYYNVTPDCPTGFSYVPVHNQCEDAPFCSSGVYNTSRDFCEKTRANSCPMDYAYSSTYSICQLIPPCPSPGTYNTSYNDCRTPKSLECPSGMTYNSSLLRCEVVPPCSLPFSYSTTYNRCQRPADHTCESPYSYVSGHSQCEASFTCPPPSVFVSARDKCEKAPENQCEPGFTWNSAYGYCTYPPICEPSATYSAANNRCEKTADNYCAPGLTFDSSLGYCWAAPTCESPATYSAANNRCEKTADNSCTLPYSYVSGNDRCETAPPCQSPGIYNVTYDWCQKPTDNYCDSPFIYDGSTYCNTPPPCESPATYSTTNNRCELPATAIYTCPNTGSTYGDATTCQSACPITSGCAYTLANLTISNPAVSAINSVTVTGDKTINFLAGATTVSILTSNTGLYFAGSASGNFSKMQCFGSSIGLYDGASLSGTIQLKSGECSITTYTCSSGYIGKMSALGTSGFYAYNSSNTYCGSIYLYSYNCPGGTQYPCTGGGSANPGTCSYNQACTASYSCPSGYSLSGSTCYKAVTCPTGSSLSTTRDVCYKSVTRCTDAYVYSGTYCYKPVACPDSGTLNSDVCTKTPTRCTDTSYSYASGGICYKAPTCSTGLTYSSTYDRCQVAVTRCLGTGFIYSSGICYATPTCPAGSTLGLGYDACYMNVARCLDGYTWNSAYNACQLAPTCPSSGTYSTTYDLCYKSDTDCATGTYYLGTDVCYQNVSCPGASVLDGGFDVCYQSATNACPIGYTYSAAYNLCIAPVVCPSSGTLQTTRDKCEVASTLTCDDAFSWNATYSICQKTATCTDGSLDTALDKCVLPGTIQCTSPFVNANNRCENAAVCYSGSVLNGASDKCEMAPSYTCDLEYSFNSSTTSCQRTPSCYSPGTFDSSIDTCRADYTYYCDPGFAVDATVPVCTMSPICPSGTLNPTLDTCESTPSYSCGPVDYTYNAVTGFCQGDPDCLKGNYNSTSHMCQLEAQFCSSGFTFDQPGWKCYKDPSCVKGNYSVSSHMCETTPRFCPTQFQFIPSDFVCRATADCTPGTLNTTTDHCDADPKCYKTENKQFICVYDDPANHTGLHCDDSSFPAQTYEVRRNTLMKCEASAQCDIVCVISVPDGSGGYTNQQRPCTDAGNDSYVCPNEGYSVARECGCLIKAFSGDEVKESDCTVSCMVVSPNSHPGGNVANDYIIKECAQTFVNNNPVYACPLVGAEYIYQDCGCIDTFGLPTGVMGALIDAIRDKECIP